MGQNRCHNPLTRALGGRRLSSARSRGVTDRRETARICGEKLRPTMGAAALQKSGRRVTRSHSRHTCVSILGPTRQRRSQNTHTHQNNTSVWILYLEDSQDVGFSFRSLNLVSICCVGPSRQNVGLNGFSTAQFNFKPLRRQTRGVISPSPHQPKLSFPTAQSESDDVTLHHASDKRTHSLTCPPLCNKFAGTSGDCVHHVAS